MVALPFDPLYLPLVIPVLYSWWESLRANSKIVSDIWTSMSLLEDGLPSWPIDVLFGTMCALTTQVSPSNKGF